MSRLITSVDDTKLLVGGSKAGSGALAQVSAADHTIDFAQTYSQVESVVAVIRSPEEAASSLVALGITKINKIFLLETGPDGTLLQEPIEITYSALDSSDGGSLEETLFSMSFNEDGNVVIAMGHEDIKISSEVVVVNLIDRMTIERVHDEFTYEHAHRMLSYYGPYEKGVKFAADRDCPTLDYMEADLVFTLMKDTSVTQEREDAVADYPKCPMTFTFTVELDGSEVDASDVPVTFDDDT